MVRPERRVVLAGASPVRVSAEAPGSRLQPGGEIRPSQAECQKPLKERGASRRAATISERNSLVKSSAERCSGGPSRSFGGEGNRQHPFLVASLRRWPYRPGGAGSGRTKRDPGTGDQLARDGSAQPDGQREIPAQATPRRLWLSRAPENGPHPLKGDIRNGPLQASTALNFYQCDL